jgi:drug/metabolite transporter (DMT)-like permease
VGELLAIASCLLFAVNVLMIGPASRRIPQDLGFLLALASNVAVAVVVVVVQYVVSSPGAVEWDAVALFALGGLLTSYLGRWFFMRSVTTIGPTRASALQSTSPVFTGLAAWILLGETLPPEAILCGLTVLAGLYLTSRPTVSAGAMVADRMGSRSIPVTEIGLGLLGAAAYGLGNVARGAGVRDWEAPIVGALTGAAAGLLLYAVANTDLRKLSSALRGADPVGRWLWFVAGTLTIGAQTCLIAASLYIPVAIGVVISSAVPLVVLPVSVLFFRRTEAVGPVTGLGALLILAGIAGLLLT